MRQYTTPEQTAKLIELGVEKPRCLHNCELAYNVGELIEMLPDDGGTKAFNFDGFDWYVDWDSFDCIRQTSGVELLDALYNMVLRLKEEGVI